MTAPIPPGRGASVGRPVDVDVIIVGQGPVGATLANLLGMQGLSVCAIDRESQIMQIPRGVGIDGEMMRIMQTLGLAERLEPLLKVFRGAQYLDVDGHVVATRPGVSGVGRQGWPDRYNVHQPDLEMVLADGLTRFANVEVLRGVEVTDIVDSDDHATVSVTDLVTGERRTMTANFVVGCDGGRSIVRRIMDVDIDDFGLNEPWIVCDFAVSPDADLPDINTHFADPVTPAIYIHVVRDIRRFEFRAKPDEDLEAVLEPDAVWARVSRWLAPDQATLLRSAVYTHRALVVRPWRRGRLMLAGDAAHLTPPFLGQGLCAGMRDVAALGWRLRAVVEQGAPSDVLDSYSIERAGHAEVLIRTSTQLGATLTKPDKDRLTTLNAQVGREGRGAAPRLGRGLWRDDEIGGYLAPQPRLDDDRLLDDVVGYRFCLIATDEVSAALPQETMARLAGADIAVVPATGPAADWLAQCGAAGIIVRPDRYGFAAAHTPDDVVSALDDLLASLPMGALTG